MFCLLLIYFKGGRGGGGRLSYILWLKRFPLFLCRRKTWFVVRKRMCKESVWWSWGENISANWAYSKALIAL